MIQAPSRSDSPVAVIGAGPGGLAAAVLLAASGIPVRIYESQPTIGGRTARITLGDFHFDRGPTFFLMPYVLEEIFAAAGRRLADYADLRRLDPMYRLTVGRPDAEPWTLDATPDLPEMARRLAAFDHRDGPAFHDYITHNRAKLRRADPILRSPIRGLRDLMNLDALRVAPYLDPHLSVHGYLKRRFRHPVSRLAMSFQAKYLGMSPMECPALFSFLPFIEYEYGIWHPIGGCNALMDALARVALELGAEIRTGCPVDRLEFEGRQLTGVVAGGERFAHRHAVVNADAAWALKRLVPESLRGPDTDAALDAKRYSCSTFMLYLALDGTVDLPHHSIYISSKYDDNLADISSKGRLSVDPSIYACNPGATDPTLAPRGSTALYVLMPTPNLTMPLDWNEHTPRARALVLEQLERRLGIDRLESRIRHELVVTPADWQRLGINHGATFNLAHNLGQLLHKRVQHRYPHADGLWFVGGATHPGSGLPVIFVSSQITAKLLAQELGVTPALAGSEAAFNLPRSRPRPAELAPL